MTHQIVTGTVGIWPPLNDPAAWEALLLTWVAVLVAVSAALIGAYAQLRRMWRDLQGLGSKVDRHDQTIDNLTRRPPSPPPPPFRP